MKDLIILVEDSEQEASLNGLLSKRSISLGIRNISYDFIRQLDYLPQMVNLLRTVSIDHDYALVFLDWEENGKGIGKNPKIVETKLRNKIARNNLFIDVEVIVFDPELEIWAWVDSPNVAKPLGWDNYSKLKNYIIDSGKNYWNPNNLKPQRPKEALELAIEKKMRRTSGIYYKIAEKVSLSKCQDPSFIKFKTTLQNWFPAQ